MKRLMTTAAMIAAACSTVLLAKNPDQRLATVRKAFIVTADEMSDGKPIAACLASHLSNTTPLTAVDAKAEADVILTVTNGHLPGNTARAVFGGAGRVDLSATLPDGTILWEGTAKFASGGESSLHLNIACNLADQIADKLRQAMRTARDKK